MSTLSAGALAMALAIQSKAFSNNGKIPETYTCESKDISPELSWSGIPEGAKSLVLIVDDPDAPDPAAPKMTYVHWVLYNLPPESTGLAENVSKSDLPSGTLEGINDWKKPGYGGPCPPIGSHRYYFKLYALDTKLPNLSPGTKSQVEEAMKGHVLEQATLMGTYQKQK